MSAKTAGQKAVGVSYDTDNPYIDTVLHMTCVSSTVYVVQPEAVR